ncbi:hypothetical protein ACLB2K_019037 [Fragaria x ananassa]
MRDMIRRKEQAIKNGERVCKEQEKNGMTVEDVIEECKLFHYAGQETTASSYLEYDHLVYASKVARKSKRRGPACLWKQSSRFGCHESPQNRKLMRRSKYQKDLGEVLRLYAPVSALYRHTNQKTNIGGISVPAGNDLVLLTLFLHHDPKFWGENE